MPTVHSFDVFDTVLTRQVGDPDAVIDVLSKRLESDGALPVARPCSLRRGSGSRPS